MTILVMFLAGVVLLTLGANWLVQGASLIAEAFRLPKHIVGLTLVALGTSAPELFVNLIAAANGDTDFALANVSGSNLANLCLGLGICAMLSTVPLRKSEFGSDLMLLWIIPVVLLIFCYANPSRVLPWMAVLPLTALFVYYLGSLKGRAQEEIPEHEGEPNVAWGAVQFVGGVAALYFGGEWVLHAAQTGALALGIGEDVIGLTVVALGTSVPDITASIVATRKREFGIAVGNILGSNISNLVLVLNGTILVSQEALPTTMPTRGDYLAVALVSLTVFFCGWRREELPHRVGLWFVVAYVAYLVARVFVI
ncbi:MAG: calcium/sodium antiporter [Planctomycetota bacterium]